MPIWSAFVLDDYHIVTDVAIYEALNTILTHLPPKLPLIIITRADPPISLASFRDRKQLTELRASDLRFSLDEIRFRLEIGDKNLMWFESFTITRSTSRETALITSLAEQATLPGLLAKIRGLDLSLISVNQVGNGDG